MKYIIILTLFIYSSCYGQHKQPKVDYNTCYNFDEDTLFIERKVDTLHEYSVGCVMRYRGKEYPAVLTHEYKCLYKHNKCGGMDIIRQDGDTHAYAYIDDKWCEVILKSVTWTDKQRKKIGYERYDGYNVNN